MDKLKKYFKDNETYMEVDAPDEKNIWDRIESGCTNKPVKKNRVIVLMRYAAAACIIIMIGLVVLLKDKEKKVAELVVIKGTPPVMIDTTVNIITPPVITKAEIKKTQHLTTAQTKDENIISEDEADKIGKSYAKLINFQIKRLRTTAVYAEDPGYFVDFKLQLRQMDKDEASLKNDMKFYGFNDQLLEQLINMYQQKLNLLKSLQGEINKMNNKVKEKRSSDQSSPYFLSI